MNKVLSAKEAVQRYVGNGMTVAFSGFVGAMHAEEVTEAIEQSFLEQGTPNDLTVVFAAGQGDGKTRSLNHLGHEKLVTKVIGGHYNLVPAIQKLAMENKAAAYNLPQGVIAELYRDIAAGKIGLVTHVGLNTFVDPRLQGGKLNEKAAEAGELVELVKIKGQERLLYNTFPIDVGIIRASFADTHGNCSLQREGVSVDALAIAQAAKNSGGKVIVQVERVVEYGSLDTRFIKIPGIYVDAVVVADPEKHRQSRGGSYNPGYSGEFRIPVNESELKPLELSARKVIARRAAMELVPHTVTNLGIGMPEGIAAVAAEEDMDEMILTTEAGTIGGIPAGGDDFGLTLNPDCVLDEPAQFDFYDGGGLDVAFLGLAQMDRAGNINVSKFGPRIAGCGGFINITQNARKAVYCGTFTAGGLKENFGDGRMEIVQEGSVKKLIRDVEQVTFSGDYARKTRQPVLYITERAVFELSRDGVELTEIAPGIDLERDILSQMEFEPIMKDVKLMDERIFREEKMGLRIQAD